MFRLSTVFLSCLLVTTTIFAEDTYQPFSDANTNGSGNVSKKSALGIPLPPPNKTSAVSPKDFKSSVNNSFQTNQNSLNQQIQKDQTQLVKDLQQNQMNQLKALPPSVTGANSASETPANSQSTDASTNLPVATPSPVPMTTTTTVTTAPSSAPAPATQTKTYTGFGGGNTNNSKNNSNKSSSGWNVQY